MLQVIVFYPSDLSNMNFRIIVETQFSNLTVYPRTELNKYTTLQHSQFGKLRALGWTHHNCFNGTWIVSIYRVAKKSRPTWPHIMKVRLFDLYYSAVCRYFRPIHLSLQKSKFWSKFAEKARENLRKWG